MKSCLKTINIYLLGVALLMVAVVGCESKEEKQKKSAMIQLHLEVDGDVVRRSSEVPIIRSTPVMINLAEDVIVPDYYMESARMVETPEGGYAIRLKYDLQGTWTLRNVTAVNIGKHIGVYAAFHPDTRWLAAPVINKAITNGVFSFIPDASREEARRIVDGVNYSIEQRKKDSFFDD